MSMRPLAFAHLDACCYNLLVRKVNGDYIEKNSFLSIASSPLIHIKYQCPGCNAHAQYYSSYAAT